MNKLILLAFLSVPCVALDVGDTPSNHNDPMIAFEQAVLRLQEQGCGRIKRTKVSKVTQYRESDPNTLISGQVFRVSCTKWIKVSVKVVLEGSPMHKYEVLRGLDMIPITGNVYIGEFQPGTYQLEYRPVGGELRTSPEFTTTIP